MENDRKQFLFIQKVVLSQSTEYEVTLKNFQEFKGKKTELVMKRLIIYCTLYFNGVGRCPKDLSPFSSLSLYQITQF